MPQRILSGDMNHREPQGREVSGRRAGRRSLPRAGRWPPVRPLSPRTPPPALAHKLQAIGCLRFCRVKDFCDACVSLLLLAVYGVFENVCFDFVSASRALQDLQSLILHFFFRPHGFTKSVKHKFPSKKRGSTKSEN